MTAARGAKQQTKMLRVECPLCGYLLRGTRKWLELAVPHCPVDNYLMVVDWLNGAPDHRTFFQSRVAGTHTPATLEKPCERRIVQDDGNIGPCGNDSWYVIEGIPVCPTCSEAD